MARQAIGSVGPTLDASDLVQSLPELALIAQIESESVRRLSSVNLSFSDVAAVAQRIQAARRTSREGIVVTVGTDTLEETAFLLDLLLEPGEPVVVTGALRDGAQASADGAANLLAAVRVAASPVAANLGVLVVVNDEVHAARFVRKTHTYKVSAFASPLLGPLGWVSEDRVRILLRLSHRLPTLSWNGEPPGVPLVLVGFASHGELLSYFRGSSIGGLVVAGVGAGQIPTSWVFELERLAARIPVVLSTRIGVGECLRHSYGYVGGGSDLLKRGLIAGGWLDAAKARILLSMLLANGADKDQIRASFNSLSE
jgi:L-asparaginase